jgi:hypothetical protein
MRHMVIVVPVDDDAPGRGFLLSHDMVPYASLVMRGAGNAWQVIKARNSPYHQLGVSPGPNALTNAEFAAESFYSFTDLLAFVAEALGDDLQRPG